MLQTPSIYFVFAVCFIFVCCIHHRIIRIASALRCRHVLKLAFVRRCRFSLCLHHLPSDRLAFVTVPIPTGFFESLLSDRLTPLCAEHRPLARVRNSPDPDPDFRYRWIRILPRQLYNITVFFVGLS